LSCHLPYFDCSKGESEKWLKKNTTTPEENTRNDDGKKKKAPICCNATGKPRGRFFQIGRAKDGKKTKLDEDRIKREQGGGKPGFQIKTEEEKVLEKNFQKNILHPQEQKNAVADGGQKVQPSRRQRGEENEEDIGGGELGKKRGPSSWRRGGKKGGLPGGCPGGKNWENAKVDGEKEASWKLKKINKSPIQENNSGR